MADSILPPEIVRLGQRHILRFWDELDSDAQAKLVQQLGQIDWKLVESFSENEQEITDSQTGRAAQFAPPANVVRRPRSADEIAALKDAHAIGENALRAGKVGAILLAGGQGTRLGFPHPKGTYPIGPVSNKSLFAILAEQIVALSEKYRQPIPYLVMTSDGTHDETIAFFHEQDYFGLSRDNVYFFQQGYAPSLDAMTGELLLAGKGAISMNPDGHGGLLAALLKAGLFEELRRRGVEYLFSHQVDNPLVNACDPGFIGLHIKHKSDVSTKVVAKTGPEEKVGVAVNQAGRTAIIEYSDLPVESANQRELNGELRFWAGSTAIHLFDVTFLEQIATSEHSLPWHRAVKKIPFVDRQGNHIQPEKENGIKYERFLFDTLPLASIALIVETSREEEFAPLKNQSGDFSPEYVRQQMMNVARNWLRNAGVSVPDEVPVEISPRFARTADDLAARKSELLDLVFDRPTYLGAHSHELLNAGKC